MKTNELPKRDMSKSTTGCCPPFEPADWNGQTFVFDKKLFVKFKTHSFLHIPVNMNAAMMKNMGAIDKAKAHSDDYLMLSDEVSPWKAEHYIAVAQDVPGAEMVKLSGKYLAKVFDGPYSNMRKWYQELLDYVKSKDAKVVKVYFNYTMCPRCSKAYGHNYVVGFAQVE